VDKSRKHIKLPVQLFGWLIIITIVTCGISVLLEISVRIMLPNINVLLNIVTPTAGNRIYVLKPNASTVYSGLYGKTSTKILWNISSQGLRSDSLIEKKPENTFRILTYGDSETFGWSVNLDNTWQRQMEQIDRNVQVINLGIPGYNIESIAIHVEKTILALQPDLVVYLFNKNDVYKPLNYHPRLSKSYLYLIANMGIYQLKAKQRKEWRKSQEGVHYFFTHLQRIISICEHQHVPLILAILHWKYTNMLPDQHKTDQHRLTNHPANPEDNNLVRTINVENVIKDYPRRDGHLIEPAHQALAQHLCRVISSGIDQQCRP